MQQPDVEIYLRDADPAAIRNWLQQAIGPCTEWQTHGSLLKCDCQGIPVVWIAQAVGKWHSLLLESPQTPWATDLDCAHAAHAALAIEVRCAPGSWQESEGEEGADDWISVSDQGERQIVWHTQ